jgi:dihydroorotate dehydrogenase
MYRLIKFLLFLLPPEKAHDVALNLIELALRIPVIGAAFKRSFNSGLQKSVEFAGIRFPNIIGLAAGFDKDAKRLSLWKALGFGHVEVGTVTPKAQPGNLKPRLFRLVDDRAVINRMGFNNGGVDAMVERLKKRPEGLIVGGNIGKNKDTPNEFAIEDYVICFEKLYPYVDYITVNVSSPNTPGLRDLQTESFLVPLFEKLNALRSEKSTFKPIFLKIAPDFQLKAIKQLAKIIKKLPIQGLIATNTTVSRDRLDLSKKEVEKIGAGGLSGAPLFEASNAILATLSIELGNTMPIVGVGGIFNGFDVAEKLTRGAGLVQVYTGFIYEGPWIVRNILNELTFEDSFLID